MNENRLRSAKVFYQNQLAGVLSECENGYRFTYDSSYLSSGKAISLTLPLQSEPYESTKLFSFFSGLLPEGWYRDIVRNVEKIDTTDSFGILLATAGDAIGAVTIQRSVK